MTHGDYVSKIKEEMTNPKPKTMTPGGFVKVHKPITMSVIVLDLLFHSKQ